MKQHPSWESRDFSGVHLERRAGGGLPLIKGLASPFEKLSEDLGGFRERVIPGAFRASINGERRDVAAMREHKPELLLGRQSSGTLKFRETHEGLEVSITPPNTEFGRQTVEEIRRGDLHSMSIGFVAVDVSWSREGGEDIRVLRDVDLFDVSVVAFPAYPDTSVAVRSLQSWSRSKGVDLDYEERKRDIEMYATGSNGSPEREYEYRCRQMDISRGSSLRAGSFAGFIGRMRADRSRRIDRLAERSRALKRSIEFENLPAVHSRHDERREFVNWLNARRFDIVYVASHPEYQRSLKQEFLNANWVPLGGYR